MLGFLLKKPALLALAGLAIVTILGTGYRHYTGVLDEIEALHAQAAAQGVALDTERAAVQDLSEVVGEWEQSQDRLLERIVEMQSQAREARDETRRLRQLFAEIDFESMAPAALDSTADAITDRLWRLLDDATDPGRHGAGGEASSETSAPETGPGGDDPDRLDRSRDGPRPSTGTDG